VRFEQEIGRETVNRLPRWRIAAAVVTLTGLLLLAARITPIYLRNRQFDSAVSELAREQGGRAQSDDADDALRARVVEKAQALALPVAAGDVRIVRRPDGTRIDVRYFVRVDLPGYTVDLHFHSGGG
jgi:hypothetical protein